MKRFFDKLLTAKIWVQILIFLVVFLISLLCLMILYTFYHVGGDGTVGVMFSRSFADMLDADRFISYAYEGGVSTSVKIVTIISGLIGAIVFEGLLIATITNIFQSRADKVKTGDVHYKFKKHILILGFDKTTPSMVKNLRTTLGKSKELVIAVESDVEKYRSQLEVFLSSDETMHLTVLHANRTLTEDLERLCVSKADKIYIMGEINEDDHDTQNLNCFKKIIDVCKSDHLPQCYVFLAHQTSFDIFQTYNSNNSDFDKFMSSFHPFNINELWAREVVVNTNNVYAKNLSLDWRSEQNNIYSQPQKFVHTVIMGMSEIGEAISRMVALVAHYPNFIQDGKLKTRITFVDPNAYEKMICFKSRYDSLFKHCHWSFRKYESGMERNTMSDNLKEDCDFLDVEFEFVESEIADSGMRDELTKWCFEEDRFLSLFLCFDNAIDNMSLGCSLPPVFYSKSCNIPVWIYQPIPEKMDDFFAKSKYKNLHSFGMTDKQMQIDDAKEVFWAKKLNYSFDRAYEKDEIEDVKDWKIDWSRVPDSEINEKWDKLIIAKRWSNINNASSLSSKIRSISPKEKISKEEAEDCLLENIHILMNVEHNRWMVERLLSGYSSPNEHQFEDLSNGKISRKDLQEDFVHCDICPYEKLDDYTKKKDEMVIRQIIDIVMR